MPRTRAGFSAARGWDRSAFFSACSFCAAAAGIMDFGVLAAALCSIHARAIDVNARADFSYRDSDEFNIIFREDAVNRARASTSKKKLGAENFGDLDKLKLSSIKPTATSKPPS